MTPYHPEWRTVAVRCKRLVESGFLDVLPMLYPVSVIYTTTKAREEFRSHYRISDLSWAEYAEDPELASLWQGVVDDLLAGTHPDNYEARITAALTWGNCRNIQDVRHLAAQASNLTEE